MELFEALVQGGREAAEGARGAAPHPAPVCARAPAPGPPQAAEGAAEHGAGAEEGVRLLLARQLQPGDAADPGPARHPGSA